MDLACSTDLYTNLANKKRKKKALPLMTWQVR